MSCGGEGGRGKGGAAVGLVAWLRPGEHERAELLARTLVATGIRHLRLGVSWADWHRPEGPAWYRWLIRRLAPVAELLPCVVYTPPSLGIEPDTASPPRDPRAYADFLDLFVSEHGECFEWIELWNEPNNLNDWDHRLDPDWMIFASMVGAAAYWMKRCGKKTVLGATCPTDPAFLDHLRRNGVLEHIDAVAVHAFPGTWTPHWRGWHDELAPVREILARCPGRPEIWITEASYSTWRHDEARQLLAFAEAAAAPVSRMYWYAFQDLDPEHSSQEGFHFDERHYHCGILGAQGRPKLLARMLAEGGVERALQTAKKLAGWRLRPAGAPPVLITGGAGFLGANLADRLAGEGRQVLVLDSLARNGVEANLDWLKDRHGARITPVIADVRDFYTLRDAARGAAAVLHLAAQVAVTTSLDDPVQDFEVNARGTLNLLEALRRLPQPPPLLFASTNKVYGKLMGEDALERTATRRQPRDPLARQGCDERTPLDLYSPYGCSKGVADQYVLDHARVFGLDTLVFRMSCLYGPRQLGTEDQGWVAHFLIRALAQEPIAVYGDGRQVRDALYVDDAVDAWLAALARIDRLKGRVFNLGGGPRNTLSLLEMLTRIERLTGRRPEVAFGPWRPGDQLWYVSDTRAFEAATGWRSRVDLDTGLRRLLDWLKGHIALPAQAASRRGASA